MTKVTLMDPHGTYLDMVVWAKEYCGSYERSNVTDVSDMSMITDLIYEFWFADSQDALIFKLKWE